MRPTSRTITSLLAAAGAGFAVAVMTDAPSASAEFCEPGQSEVADGECISRQRDARRPRREDRIALSTAAFIGRTDRQPPSKWRRIVVARGSCSGGVRGFVAGILGILTLLPRACFCLGLDEDLVVCSFVVDGLGAVVGSGCFAAGHGQCAAGGGAWCVDVGDGGGGFDTGWETVFGCLDEWCRSARAVRSRRRCRRATGGLASRRTF